MRYHCRCRICRKRTTLARHPDSYRIRVKCKKCGGTYANARGYCIECGSDMSLAPKCSVCRGRLRLDQDANGRPWRRRPICRCIGVPFPHRPQLHGHVMHCGATVLAWCEQTTNEQAKAFQRERGHE